MKKSFVTYWYVWLIAFLGFLIWYGQPKKQPPQDYTEKCKEEIRAYKDFVLYEDSLTALCSCVNSKLQKDYSKENLERSMTECFRKSMIDTTKK